MIEDPGSSLEKFLNSTPSSSTEESNKVQRELIQKSQYKGKEEENPLIINASVVTQENELSQNITITKNDCKIVEKISQESSNAITETENLNEISGNFKDTENNPLSKKEKYDEKCIVPTTSERYEQSVENLMSSKNSPETKENKKQKKKKVRRFSKTKILGKKIIRNKSSSRSKRRSRRPSKNKKIKKNIIENINSIEKDDDRDLEAMYNSFYGKRENENEEEEKVDKHINLSFLDNEQNEDNIGNDDNYFFSNFDPKKEEEDYYIKNNIERNDEIYNEENFNLLCNQEKYNKFYLEENQDLFVNISQIQHSYLGVNNSTNQNTQLYDSS